MFDNQITTDICKSMFTDLEWYKIIRNDKATITLALGQHLNCLRAQLGAIRIETNETATNPYSLYRIEDNMVHTMYR